MVDDSSVVCTPNHKFLCENGDEEEWVEAKDLVTQLDDGFQASRFIKRNDGSTTYPIESISLGIKEEVFDIEVEEVHCFVLENGCIAHNCQDFSREGKNDINTGRSILYERTLQILDPNPKDNPPELTRQPKLVVWENVPNMAYSHPAVLSNYLQTMESYGYTNTFCGSKKYVEKGGYVSDRSIMVDHMLKASDYGIPQARDRFFCISILNELADEYGPYTMPQPIPLKYQLKDFLDLKAPMNAPETSFTANELSILKRVNNQWYVKQAVKTDVGAGVGYVPINNFQRVDLAFPNSANRRGRVGDCASTLTTSPRQGVLINNQFRLFTSKEKLRLMGYRDADYERMRKVGLTDAQIAKLAGNSICVPVLEHIFAEAFNQYPELCNF
jgi:DNA (cytosine-5)-methyltransferase 1